MKLTTLASFLLLSCFTDQSKVDTCLHGSLITVELGRDGIVVCADSRAMIKRDDHPFAYFDSAAKITEVRSVVFGTTGVANIGHRSLLALGRSIQNKVDWNNGPLSFIVNYSRALRSTFTKEELEIIRDNDFIVASYLNYKPAIYEFTLQDLLDKSQVNPMRTYYVTASPAFKFLKYDSTAKCKRLARFAEKAIRKYANEFHIDFSVGGPISIVQITPDSKVHWIKNRFDTLQRTDWPKLNAAGKLSLKRIDEKQWKLADSLENKYKKEHPGS